MQVADQRAEPAKGLARWRGRTVGIVFQFFQLLPTLTALENTALPMDFARRWPSPSRHPAPSRRRHQVRLI